MSGLANKIAVVIGGGGGIGGAITQRFAAEGAEVYATSRAPAESSGRIHAVQADAGRLDDLAAVFARVREERGRIDALVINAGVGGHAPLGEIGEDQFDAIFDLNVRALAFAAQGGLALLPDGGSIVLIGSIAGVKGARGYSAYAASKAAVRSLARTWAAELAPRRIRVNVVSPGPIDTAMFARVTDEMRRSLISLIPLGRLGRPEEVAAAALFLASDQSSFTTGSELFVDGGAAQV